MDISAIRRNLSENRDSADKLVNAYADLVIEIHDFEGDDSDLLVMVKNVKILKKLADKQSAIVDDLEHELLGAEDELTADASKRRASIVRENKLKKLRKLAKKRLISVRKKRDIGVKAYKALKKGASKKELPAIELRYRKFVKKVSAVGQKTLAIYNEIKRRIKVINNDLRIRRRDFGVRTIRIDQPKIKGTRDVRKETFATNAKTVGEFAHAIFKQRRRIKKLNPVLINLVVAYIEEDGHIGHITYDIFHKIKSRKDLESVLYAVKEYTFIAQGTGGLQYETLAKVLDINWFSIYYVFDRQMPAGGRAEFHDIIRTSKTRGRYLLRSYRSNKNNCALAIMRHVSGNKSSYTKVRKDCKFGPGKLDMNDQHILRTLGWYFNMRVVNERTGKESTISGTLKDVRIFVIKNHAYQVITHEGKKIVNNVIDHVTNKQFVFYDIEAVYDYIKGRYVTFSISWVHNGEKHFHLGWDAFEVFANSLEKIVGDRVYILGFNNSGFDDYELLRHLLKNDTNPYTFTFKNRVFLSFGRYITRDVFKYISPMSLDDFCHRFKLVNKKKGHQSFKWEELNLYYNKYGMKLFMDYIRDNYLEELEVYNNYDVLSIEEGFHLIRNLLKKNGFGKGDKPVEIENYITLGQCAKRQLINSQGGVKYGSDYNSLEEYYEIRSSMVAGISYANGKKNVDLDHFLGDIVSLYPYVMSHADFMFPCGDYVVEETYSGKSGSYLCKNIDQAILGNNKNIIPIRDGADNTYNWYVHDIIPERMLCTVDINQLLKYGCTVDIGRGYSWSDMKSGREIYGGYMDKFRDIKSGQDVLRASKPLEYNQGLRELAKIYINVISGKTAQIYTYENEDKIIKDEDVLHFVATHNEVKLSQYSSEYYFVSGKKKMDNKPAPKNNLQAHAIWLYAYARRHMYDHVIFGMNPLIIETDSSLIHKNKLEALQLKTIKSIMGETIPLVWNKGSKKYFGQLECEIDNIKLCLAPRKKCYYLEYLKDGKIYTKRRFKGLSRKWLAVPDHIMKAKKANVGEIAWMEMCEKFYQSVEIKLNDSKEFDYDEPTEKYSCLSKSNYYKFFDHVKYNKTQTDPKKHKKIPILQRLITRVFHIGKPYGNQEGKYVEKTLSLKLEYRVKRM